MTARLPVSVPVEATTDAIEIRILPPRKDFIAPDDANVYPWAVAGRCYVTFHFGRFVTSKNIGKVHPFPDHDDRPTDVEISDAAAEVEAFIRVRLGEHGIDPSTIPTTTALEAHQ